MKKTKYYKALSALSILVLAGVFQGSYAANSEDEKLPAPSGSHAPMPQDEGIPAPEFQDEAMATERGPAPEPQDRYANIAQDGFSAAYGRGAEPQGGRISIKVFKDVSDKVQDAIHKYDDLKREIELVELREKYDQREKEHKIETDELRRIQIDEWRRHDCKGQECQIPPERADGND